MSMSTTTPTGELLDKPPLAHGTAGQLCCIALPPRCASVTNWFLYVYCVLFFFCSLSTPWQVGARLLQQRIVHRIKWVLLASFRWRPFAPAGERRKQNLPLPWQSLWSPGKHRVAKVQYGITEHRVRFCYECVVALEEGVLLGQTYSRTEDVPEILQDATWLNITATGIGIQTVGYVVTLESMKFCHVDSVAGGGCRARPARRMRSPWATVCPTAPLTLPAARR